VGPLEQWHSDPFQPLCKDGMLYGRGAADMKASLAAFVTAAEALLAARPARAARSPSCSLRMRKATPSTAPSSSPKRCAGGARLIDYCIIGEPTARRDARRHDQERSPRIAVGETDRQGNVQGHIAYPHLASNPIHRAAPAIARLAARVWDEGNASFPPTTWQVSNIHGGTGASNVIPGHVVIDFNFRFGTASSPETLQQTLCAILDQEGLQYDLSWTLGARPFLTGRGALIDAALTAIRAETGIAAELSTTGGTSDGRFIAEICPQVLEIGPVNASIHKVNECVEAASLGRLSAIYRRVLEQLLPSHV
jgi:succinyl-diaminopimelate desuccinylase